jgi:hypothetical protein
LSNKIQTLKLIIKKIINEDMSDNRQLKVRNFKGYGSSHAHAERVATNLGISPSDKLSIDIDSDISSEKKKVKVSKAFSKKLTSR